MFLTVRVRAESGLAAAPGRMAAAIPRSPRRGGRGTRGHLPVVIGVDIELKMNPMSENPGMATLGWRAARDFSVAYLRLWARPAAIHAESGKARWPMVGFCGIPPIGQEQRRPMDGAPAVLG